MKEGGHAKVNKRVHRALVAQLLGGGYGEWGGKLKNVECGSFVHRRRCANAGWSANAAGGQNGEKGNSNSMHFSASRWMRATSRRILLRKGWT